MKNKEPIVVFEFPATKHLNGKQHFGNPDKRKKEMEKYKKQAELSWQRNKGK